MEDNYSIPKLYVTTLKKANKFQNLCLKLK